MFLLIDWGSGKVIRKSFCDNILSENIGFYLHLLAKHLAWKRKHLTFSKIHHCALNRSICQCWDLQELYSLYQVSVTVWQRAPPPNISWHCYSCWTSLPFYRNTALECIWCETHQGDWARGRHPLSQWRNMTGKKTKPSRLSSDKLPCTGQSSHHQNQIMSPITC